LKRKISQGALSLALLTSSTAAIAAKEDSQIWTQASASVKLSDAWRLSGEVVGRFSDNRNGLYEIEATALVGYRVAKNVTVWGGYVHDPLYSGGDFTVMEHRAREQVTLDNVGKIGSGKLNARIRMEQRWRDGIDGTGWRLRPYAKLSFPVHGKTALNLSNETFVNLNKNSLQRQTGVDRMRNLVSISTPLGKKLTGEAGYLNQYGFVRNGTDTMDHVAYFAVSASF
jgi:hypothetical protein